MPGGDDVGQVNNGSEGPLSTDLDERSRRLKGRVGNVDETRARHDLHVGDKGKTALIARLSDSNLSWFAPAGRSR